MDAEDDFFRPAPKRPYQPVKAQLRIPADGLRATLALLQRAGRLESGLFWYGPRGPDGNGLVQHIAAPRQRMSWGNYHVAPEALAEIVHGLPDGFAPLGQVHSHPSQRVEHSNYDDKMLSSRRALSLVFPFYGRPKGAFPLGVGVHEWQIDYWHLLDKDVAARRVIVTEGTVSVEDRR
jgi:hypothetical protein